VSTRNIEFVVAGIKEGEFVLKNMLNGEQVDCSLEELIEIVQ
jgi:hypothetical protein